MILEDLSVKIEQQTSKLASLRAERTALEARRRQLWVAEDLDGQDNAAALDTVAARLEENAMGLERAELVLAELLTRRDSITEEIASVHHKTNCAELEALNKETIGLDKAFHKVAAPFFQAMAALAIHERRKRRLAYEVQRFCDKHPGASGVGPVPSAHQISFAASGEMVNWSEWHNLTLDISVGNSSYGFRTLGIADYEILGKLASHYRG
jgi:hypothetical protein